MDDELLNFNSKRRMGGCRNRYDDRKVKQEAKDALLTSSFFTVEEPQTLPSLKGPIEVIFLLLLNEATRTWNTYGAKTRTHKKNGQKSLKSTYIFSILPEGSIDL